MIRRALFGIVLTLALASAEFGQDTTGNGQVVRSDLQEKSARPGALVTPEKIHPQVRAMAQTNPLVAVFVVLVDQPQKAIFERAQAASQLRREIVEGRYQELATMLFPASDALQQARQAVDQVEIETRQSAFREIEQSIGAGQNALETDLAGMGGRNISRYRGVNMLALEIPSSALPLLESDPRIAEVFPIERHRAQLATSVPALGAPAFWSNGDTGQGQAVAVLDTGVRTNHPAFTGKNIVSRVFLTAGSHDSCFGDDASSAEDQNGHGTHVSGIVMSQGMTGWLNYQGVAKGIDTLYNVKIAFIEKSGGACAGSTAAASISTDTFSGLDWVVSNTPAKIVNHSLGGTVLTDDSAMARTWDQYADNYGLAVAVAAGNAGLSGARTVEEPGIAYNVICVANWLTRGTIWDTSSRGPTLGGRYKPDIAAPGKSIWSAAYDWEAGPVSYAFMGMTGTSMAAPHVAGSIALLRAAGVTNPLAAKAVLLNTTDNPGWAADSGWGYANLTTAWGQRSSATGSLTASGSPTGYKLYKLVSSGSLRATATWNRHVVGGSTSAFNSISLYLYEDSTGNMLDSSAETIQNVQQVSATYSGNAVLKVQMASAPLSGVGSEPFGVAFSTSNWAAASGPNLGVSCTGPSQVAPNAVFSVSCTARNSGDLTAVSVSGGAHLAGASAGAPQGYGSVAPQASASRTWSITAPASVGDYSVLADVSSASFGGSYSATGSLGFGVRLSPSGPAIGSISPATPSPGGASQILTVSGSGFQSGLTVTAFPPGGGSSTLSGAQIQSVTSGGFQLAIALNSAGTWGIRVNNPDTLQSATYNFTVQCAYAISTSGLGVPSSGGSIGLNIHTDAGCQWSITNVPGWLTVSGGTQGTGPASVTLTAGASGARSASLSVGGVSVPVRQLDAGACGGSASCGVVALPHLAFGGQWTSGLSAISSGTAAGNFSASFYGDTGAALALPFTGGLGNLSTLTATVPPQGMNYYEAENASLPEQSGWALVAVDDFVAAQVAFRRRTSGNLFYEAAVPSSGGYSRFVMPFDVTTFAPNGAQLYTAFALVNLNPSAGAQVACTARNQSGVLIPNAVTIPALSPLGHFVVSNLPALVGQRGTLDCSADTLVAAIALRAIGGDAFSTLPVIPK